jgi:hypothetical protein
MKISRRGTFANHGTTSVELKKVNVSWDARGSNIVIKSSGIRDFSTDSNHNYTISIPLEDFAKIIKAVGLSGVASSATDLEAALETEIKALHRILAAATGLLTPADTGEA